MILSLNGTNGHLRFGPWPLLGTAASYAILCKFNSLPPSFAGVIAQHVGGANTIQGGIYMNSNGRASYINHSASQDVPVGHAITANEWVLIVITKTAGTTIPRSHLYRLATGTWLHADCGGTVANPSLGTSPGTMRIGTFEANPSGFANMKVALVGVWNVALSDVECVALTTNNRSSDWKSVQSAALKLLAECSSLTTIPDRSGAGNPEILRVGASYITNDDPTNWTLGLPASAQHLDNIPARYGFRATLVGLADAKSLALKNNGTGSMDWATTKPSWLNVTPESSVAAGGSLGAGSSQSILVHPQVTQATPTPAQTLFVSPSGDDAHDGLSEETAVRTLGRAATLATPGTDIYVYPGTYAAENLIKHGTSTDRIRWISVEKWGATVPSGTWWSSHYTDVIDFECTGGIAVDGLVVDGNFSRLIGAHVHHITADGSLPAGGSGILLGGSVNYLQHHIEAINCVVHDIVDSAVTWSSHVHPIYVNVPDCTVRNCLIYDSAGLGIHYWHASKRAIVINNTVVNCNEGILLGQGDSGADSPTPTHTGAVIVNNILAFNHAKGIDEQSSAHENTFICNTLFGNGDNTLIPNGLGSESGTLFSDPQFVDRSNENFHIPDSSPSANSGAIVAQTSAYDFDWGLRDLSGLLTVNRGAHDLVPVKTPIKSPRLIDDSISFTSATADNTPQVLGFSLLVFPSDNNDSGVSLPISPNNVNTIDEIPLTEEFTNLTGVLS